MRGPGFLPGPFFCSAARLRHRVVVDLVLRVERRADRVVIDDVFLVERRARDRDVRDPARRRCFLVGTPRRIGGAGWRAGNRLGWLTRDGRAAGVGRWSWRRRGSGGGRRTSVGRRLGRGRCGRRWGWHGFGGRLAAFNRRRGGRCARRERRGRARYRRWRGGRRSNGGRLGSGSGRRRGDRLSRGGRRGGRWSRGGRLGSGSGRRGGGRLSRRGRLSRSRLSRSRLSRTGPWRGCRGLSLPGSGRRGLLGRARRWRGAERGLARAGDHDRRGRPRRVYRNSFWFRALACSHQAERQHQLRCCCDHGVHPSGKN